MHHMTVGVDAPMDGSNFLHSVAYVTFQELATRVSHRNTGLACGDPIADRMLARVAADENLHMIFYRNLGEASVQEVLLTLSGDPWVQAEWLPVIWHLVAWQRVGIDLETELTNSSVLWTLG